MLKPQHVTAVRGHWAGGSVGLHVAPAAMPKRRSSARTICSSCRGDISDGVPPPK